MSLEQKLETAERMDEILEFEPLYDWVHDESSDTLILMLPGFKKEHLRVQIALTRSLRLSGEKEIRPNIWRQFSQQFSIPPDSDINDISAKFEGGMLYVKLPKLIKPQPPTPTTTAPTRQKDPKPPQQSAPPQGQPSTQVPRANEQKPLKKASEANIENTNKPPPPTPTATTHQEPKAEAKPEKKEAPKAAPTPMPPLEEPKKEVNSSQKEKGKSEGTTSKIEKRSHTLEMLSRQTQEYKNAVSGLVEELKKQKKLANLVVVTFLVLVIGLYIKNAIIKSSFGAPKIEEF